MSADASNEYDKFLQSHSVQLSISDVPERFWPALFTKLKNEVFDAGNFFSMECQIDDDDDDENEGVVEEESRENDNDNDSIEKKNVVGGDDGDGDCEDADMRAYIQSPGSISYFSRQYGRKTYVTGEKWKVVASSENGVRTVDPECIFLIDHAWTYRPNEARQYLTQSPDLLARMCRLMDIEADVLSHTEQIEMVLRRMWLYNQTYSIQNPDMPIEDRMPIWYVMDEFGSRVGHSDQPNVRFVPFYYHPQRISYTLMFPIKDIEIGEAVTRDFVEGAFYHHPEWRHFYLVPWSYSDFSSLPYEFLVPEDGFFTEGRNDEQLFDSPNTPSNNSQTTNPAGFSNDTNKKRALKVYSSVSKVREFLTHPRFEFTDSKEDADVLWLYEHFKEYRSLFEKRPSALVNQIPFESVLTVKDLLAAILHAWYSKRSADASGAGDRSSISNNSVFDSATLEPLPKWFAATYNLRTELPQFISYFQNREKLGLDNHWIIKPWNLARGLDITVTSDLNRIIRLIGSGPKIACKYVDDPVLFYREDANAWVKFDLRFIVLLRSVKPLVVYNYNRFWLRFALKEFSMDTLDDYEKHFTVFNYMDSTKIKHMFSNEFIEQFESQYPQCKWSDVQERINAALRELFEIASSQEPPKGLAPYPQCRAMYGVDVILKWTLNEKGEKVIQPVILEVNFMPDCSRACDYYPDFMNSIFECLFLDEGVSDSIPVTLI